MSITNIKTLNRRRPIELVLELNSFSGGENLRGTDVELKNNEARTIENWDALSIGGMIRSKGLSEEAVGSVTASGNVSEGGFETWSAGDASAPDDWTLAGAAAAVAKEAVIVKTGSFSAKITRNGTDCNLYQDIHATKGIAYWQGRKVKFKCWAYATVADRVRISVNDGVATGSSSFHAGTSAWVQLEAELTVDAAATRVRVLCEVVDGDTDGYFDTAELYGEYLEQLDLLVQHKEGTSTEIYGVIDGDLVIVDSSDITQEDADVFTEDAVCHAVSVPTAEELYITNATDNLYVKTIGNPIAAATDQPTEARERIYYHKFRLIAEGGGKTVYGSRAGTGNFNAADAWSLVNDAWNIDMPEDTQGCVVNFPGGDEVTVFTKTGAYAIYNFPNVTYRPIPLSHGNSAPYALARGNEGVFLVSQYPTLGVFLWTGSEWINLTQYHTFQDDIDFTKRIFGVYRDQQYHLFYHESGSLGTYPNKWRIYSTEFGRWMDRPVNLSVDDNMGYPAILEFSDRELYSGSSQKSKIYELETDDTDDEGFNTEANYVTKDFTAADFAVASGSGKFPIDEVRIKLIKVTATFYGLVGVWTLLWNADRGKVSGQQTFQMNAEGDLINSTFIVNTSEIIGKGSLPEITVTKTFNNSAVGTRFSFQILNRDTGERVQIKKLKIHAIALDEK